MFKDTLYSPPLQWLKNRARHLQRRYGIDRRLAVFGVGALAAGLPVLHIARSLNSPPSSSSPCPMARSSAALAFTST